MDSSVVKVYRSKVNAALIPALPTSQVVEGIQRAEARGDLCGLYSFILSCVDDENIASAFRTGRMNPPK